MEVENAKNKIFNFRGFFAFEINFFYEHKVLRFRWILVYLHCRAVQSRSENRHVFRAGSSAIASQKLISSGLLIHAWRVSCRRSTLQLARRHPPAPNHLPRRRLSTQDTRRGAAVCPPGPECSGSGGSGPEVRFWELAPRLLRVGHSCSQDF